MKVKMNHKYVLIFLIGVAIGVLIGFAFPHLIAFQQSGEHPLHPTFKSKTGRIWRVTHGMGICEITFTDDTKIQFFDALRIHQANLEDGHIYTIYYTGDSEPYTFEYAEEQS